MLDHPIKVLIGKPGLDGHDRGARVVARALVDAGMNVVYTGLHQTPERIAAAALEEDVDCIGLSILSGAHNHVLPRVVECLEEIGAGDIPVQAGGIIPESDWDSLKKAGIAAVFGPGTSLESIVKSIKDLVGERRSAGDSKD